MKKRQAAVVEVRGALVWFFLVGKSFSWAQSGGKPFRNVLATCRRNLLHNYPPLISHPRSFSQKAVSILPIILAICTCYPEPRDLPCKIISFARFAPASAPLFSVFRNYPRARVSVQFAFLI